MDKRKQSGNKSPARSRKCQNQKRVKIAARRPIICRLVCGRILFLISRSFKETMRWGLAQQRFS